MKWKEKDLVVNGSPGWESWLGYQQRLAGLNSLLGKCAKKFDRLMAAVVDC